MAVAKTIQFSYKDKNYTLEFDRKNVQLLERRGFNLDELGAKPMTLLPQLFWGAFQKHHKGTTQETTDEILKNLSDRDGLFSKLTDMYVDPINTLFGETEEDQGNVNWDPNW